MSAITTDSTPVTADRRRSRQAVVPVAVGSLAVTTFFNLMRADSLGESLVMIALDAVVLGLVFVLVVSRGLRQESAGGRALVLGLLGLVLCVPAYWSGLPLVLGAGAVLLGHAGRRAANGSGQAMTGFALGALAAIGYVAVYLADWIANPGASWWS